MNFKTSLDVATESGLFLLTICDSNKRILQHWEERYVGFEAVD